MPEAIQPPKSPEERLTELLENFEAEVEDYMGRMNTNWLDAFNNIFVRISALVPRDSKFKNEIRGIFSEVRTATADLKESDFLDENNTENRKPLLAFVDRIRNLYK